MLGNRHLHAAREHIYSAMARWLVRSKQPIIIIDWSDLKADRSWHLLRAAMPVGGRTLPILDMVFPGGKQGSPKAEKQFLRRSADVLPRDACPILVTDPGFRAPWFRAVDAMGWHWLGRLRNTPYVKFGHTSDEPSSWVSCKSLYTLARRTPRDLGLMHVVRSHPLACRLVLHAKPPKGRKDRNRRGVSARNSCSRKSAQRESEPWLLQASAALVPGARQAVALYTRRMQIELSFRDLKSHRCGQAFEDSLTRKGKGIEILLLLSALAAFATWLVGTACETAGIDQWLTPFRSKRRLYSVMRLGGEALVRRWSNTRSVTWSISFVTPVTYYSISLVCQHENLGKPQALPSVFFAFLGEGITDFSAVAASADRGFQSAAPHRAGSGVVRLPSSAWPSPAA